MILTVFERALILNIFPPQQGDIVALRAIREFREAVSMSPQEIEEYSVTVDKVGRMRWDSTKAKDKDVEVIPLIKERLSGILRSLSEEGKLKEEHLSLYDKFMEDG